MEQNKKYKIIYSDGQQVRSKDLIFIRRDIPFFIFFNDLTKKEEMINQTQIIRTEEAKSP